MITFIISLILITNQNDLKGFENKETAEYYAKIIGCEGYFESNINGSTYFFPCQNKDELQAIMQRREIEPKVTWIDSIPLKRAGSVNDVANLCVYLASEKASYITGQVIRVDGGLVT